MVVSGILFGVMTPIIVSRLFSCCFVGMLVDVIIYYYYNERERHRERERERERFDGEEKYPLNSVIDNRWHCTKSSDCQVRV